MQPTFLTLIGGKFFVVRVLVLTTWQDDTAASTRITMAHVVPTAIQHQVSRKANLNTTTLPTVSASGAGQAVLSERTH